MVCAGQPAVPFPVSQSHVKGFPEQHLVCKTQRIRFRKPGSGEEVLFLLKLWTRRYEGALRSFDPAHILLAQTVIHSTARAWPWHLAGGAGWIKPGMPVLNGSICFS